MLTHPTHDRLIALGLIGMAKALEEQRRQPDIAALAFEERIAMMIDREAIERIQSHGVTLNGCFVLGLDGDTEEVFDLIPRFVEETALYDVQSGKVVGPDGVVYSVANSTSIGDEGWKQMLAPAG